MAFINVFHKYIVVYKDFTNLTKNIIIIIIIVIL